jgi:transmembrane sensor
LVWAFTAAAAAALAVVIGLPSLLDRSPDLIIATGPDENRTVPLGDGSIVRLGPGSSLEFRRGRQRRATFSGVGFFAVASDSASPFVVNTEVGTAEVLGTRFELRADADSLRLVVVEGSVELASAGRNVEVGRGEMARISSGTSPTVPRSVDVWEVLDWRDGLLIFQDTPLADVVAEVGAFFDVEFTLSDATIAQRVVTAWFENEPFEEVTNTICQAVGVTCLLGDGVEIRP